jgi:hypothetical protein
VLPRNWSGKSNPALRFGALFHDPGGFYFSLQMLQNDDEYYMMQINNFKNSVTFLYPQRVLQRILVPAKRRAVIWSPLMHTFFIAGPWKWQGCSIFLYLMLFWFSLLFL